MSALPAIIVFGILMNAIAFSGSLTLILRKSVLDRILPLMVALASGALIGGALFHMIPAAVRQMGNRMPVYLWVALGMLTMLVLEQLLHWHHCHRAQSEHARPVTHLILLADGLHNLVGGISVGALFVADFRLGLTAWFAAVAHEIPQEIGDFGILVQGGWRPSRALLFNAVSGASFPLGGLLAYALSAQISIDFLIALAAGNFLYIGMVDLVPEFKGTRSEQPQFAATAVWCLGLAVLFAATLIR